MLMGIIVEVMHTVGIMEKEEIMVSNVNRRMTEVLKTIDRNLDDKLSKDEFNTMLMTPKTAMVIKDLGVDPVGLVDFAEFIFRDDEQINFPEFIQLLCQLRGANQTTVKDIVDLRSFVVQELRKMERRTNEHLSSFPSMRTSEVGIAEVPHELADAPIAIATQEPLSDQSTSRQISSC